MDKELEVPTNKGVWWNWDR